MSKLTNQLIKKMMNTPDADKAAHAPDYVPTKICIWPDREWCRFEDLEEYKWKSDDFEILNMEPGITDEDIQNQLDYVFDPK